MTIEEFAKMLRPRIEAHTPFIAYRHSKGCAVMNTGKYEVKEYDVMIGNPGDIEKRHAQGEFVRDYIVRAARLNGERIDSIRVVMKRCKVKASTVKAMCKAIVQLEKDPHIADVYTVEFDGHSVVGYGDDSDMIDNIIREISPT